MVLTNEEIEEIKKEAIEHNEKIVLNIPGIVRTDGPRRQYIESVDENGYRTLTEI